MIGTPRDLDHPGLFQCPDCPPGRLRPAEEFYTRPDTGRPSTRCRTHHSYRYSVMKDAKRRADPAVREHHRVSCERWNRAYQARRRAERAPVLEESAWRGRYAQRLVTDLKARGVSLAAIARNIGVGRETVARWQRGNCNPIDRSLSALVEFHRGVTR